jgi:hypothetical protein
MGPRHQKSHGEGRNKKSATKMSRIIRIALLRIMEATFYNYWKTSYYYKSD